MTKKIVGMAFFDEDHNIVDEDKALFVEILYDDGTLAFGVKDEMGNEK